MADDSPPPWWRRLRGELVLSLAATVLSLCAVVTTGWQTSIMRAQLRASVWPRLQVGLRYFGENESQFFRLRLDNVGVGPAIVTDVEVEYAGKPYDNVLQVFRTVMAERKTPAAAINHTENDHPHRDQVIPQQQQLMLLLAKGPGPEAADIIKAALTSLKIRIRYASIYGEEWQVDFPEDRARRVGWRDPQ